MATYKDPEKLIQAIDDALAVVMEGKVAETWKKSLQQAIDMYVYSSVPLRYKRRGDDGGLRDINNMVANYDRGSRTLTIETLATGTYKHVGWRLDDMVEKGKDYDFGGAAMEPRPFYEPADMALQEQAEVVAGQIIRLIEKSI